VNFFLTTTPLFQDFHFNENNRLPYEQAFSVDELLERVYFKRNQRYFLAHKEILHDSLPKQKQLFLGIRIPIKGTKVKWPDVA